MLPKKVKGITVTALGKRYAAVRYATNLLIIPVNFPGDDFDAAHNSPAEAEAAFRAELIDLIEDTISRRDKSNLWAVLTADTTNRETLAMALKMLKGGIDMTTPTIANTLSEFTPCFS